MVVALAEVDGAAGVAVEAGVEEAGGSGRTAPLAKVSLTDCLVGLAGADDAGVRPDRDAAPLPFLDDFGVGLVDQRAERARVAAASRQFPRSGVDQVGEIPAAVYPLSLRLRPIPVDLSRSGAACRI